MTVSTVELKNPRAHSLTETDYPFLATESLISAYPPETRDAQTLLRQVLAEGEFREKIKSIKNSGNIAQRGDEITGIAFKYLAYFLLKGNCQPDEIILSPQKTHELYQIPKFKEEIDVERKKGRYILEPDGIKFRRVGETTHIVAVYAYTARKLDPIGYSQQQRINRIQNGGAVRDLFVDRSADCKKAIGDYINGLDPEKLPPKIEFYNNEYEPKKEGYKPFIITPDTHGFPVSRELIGKVVKTITHDALAA